MSDNDFHIELELLQAHPQAPSREQVLTRFAAHHAESLARKRSHDALVAADAPLDLEDFGALAAAELGDADDDVLGEDAHAFSFDETLIETPAVTAEPTDEAGDVAAEPTDEVGDEAGDVAAEPTDEVGDEAGDVAAAADPPPATKKKKRTRQRKTKKGN
jgi:hypothetical protein